MQSDEEKEIKSLDEFGDEIFIIDEIKQMISFDIRKILSSKPIECDIIIARNYLTDLSEEDTKKIVELFSASLPNGGILLQSEIESIEKYTRDFVQKEIINRPYYVKV